MTGFQVMDGDKHVFVLEGLRDRAISYVWENVPAPENSGKKSGVSSGIPAPLKDLFTRKNVSRTCCFLMYIVMTVCIFCFEIKCCMKLLVFPLIERWIKYLNLLFKILLDSIYYLSSFH